MVKNILQDKKIVAFCPITNSDLETPDENVNESSIISSSASVNADSGKLNSFIKLCRKNTSKQKDKGFFFKL